MDMLASVFIYPTIWLAKILSTLSITLKKGSGTAIPGLFIEKYTPWVTQYYNNKFKEIIFISGTNGKTTTRALLAHIYETNGEKIVTNRGGANIFRGIASSLVLSTDIWGNVSSSTLILEVEEATLPKLTRYIKPDKLILTNIFRDQLDAYGEIDTTLEFFRKGIANCSDDLQIIINGDDQKLLSILKEGQNTTQFKLEDKARKPEFETTETVNINPLGEKMTASQIQMTDNSETQFVINKDNANFLVTTLLPGDYNIYNILASLCVALPKFDHRAIESVATFKPVFGRGEVIQVGKANLHLFLVKNPVGFDEVLHFIHQTNADKPVNICFIINDAIADGKDVSWLWDIKLEDFRVKQKVGKVLTSGERGLDMLLRLEYGGYNVKITDNINKIESLIEEISTQNADFYLLSTYTALLYTRKEIEKYTNLSSITAVGN